MLGVGTQDILMVINTNTQGDESETKLINEQFKYQHLFNLILIDDTKILVGANVIIGDNVIIIFRIHPRHTTLREKAS